ncbi:hypothetical protein [Achromobacter xylosoxidans]|uniref:hypothetical protein n=1 Tax=Alcaligenes xylosoxydans xylosoxydans TaxID=85698 RepID=UPI0006C35AAC|nr:hypothetical protein [Achromobacter xylosoxidans]CUJ55272.1 Uncharacterised protein [Achromobacter xylosoxidans]
MSLIGDSMSYFGRGLIVLAFFMALAFPLLRSWERPWLKWAGLIAIFGIMIAWPLWDWWNANEAARVFDRLASQVTAHEKADLWTLVKARFYGELLGAVIGWFVGKKIFD